MMTTQVGPYRVSHGEPLPLGATVVEGGVNFSLFSRNGLAVELLLFDRFDDPEPAAIIPLSGEDHRTFNYWHCLLEGAAEGQIYAYRVAGPEGLEEGHRFDPDKVLLDPYARGIVYADNWDHRAAARPGPNVASSMKGLVVDVAHYDWEGVTPPRHQKGERVLYEMHVRGFTRHPSAGVRHPGTFDALIEKIPYLVDLGVTSVQLMPIFQFDEGEVQRHDPQTGRRLTNYWGYSPLGYFSPHRGYYTEDWAHMTHLTGFRDMVKAMHRAGLEVFLDVVYNHTAEGDPRGPTISFRGLDNSVYYLLDLEDRSRYADFSGCGNTLNCNHPVVRRLILDSLRYWVEVMRVDGFRFDLASAMSRDERGEPMDEPPLLWEIESDPALLHTRLIAEAWDAAGLYQVGRFPGERWKEWNGQFRDDVRRFVRGDFGLARAVAIRMTGSPDLYRERGRHPPQSINFVTCHDGFPLADLVSYARKHNVANGEGNRDGSDVNHSANYGVEGPSDDPAIEALRRRQIRNLLAILMLSHGTPMLLMGDEVRRSQGGNNNAYCQDNEVSWLDWDLLERNADLHRFVKALIRFRMDHQNLRPARFVREIRGPHRAGRRPSVRWHGVQVGRPDWTPGSRTLAYTLEGPEDDPIHVLLNMHTEALDFALPLRPDGRRWRRALDTWHPSPEDIVDPGAEPLVDPHRYRMGPRTVVVLIAR